MARNTPNTEVSEILIRIRELPADEQARIYDELQRQHGNVIPMRRAAKGMTLVEVPQKLVCNVEAFVRFMQVPSEPIVDSIRRLILDQIKIGNGDHPNLDSENEWD